MAKTCLWGRGGELNTHNKKSTLYVGEVVPENIRFYCFLILSIFKVELKICQHLKHVSNFHTLLSPLPSSFD